MVVQGMVKTGYNKGLSTRRINFYFGLLLIAFVIVSIGGIWRVNDLRPRLEEYVLKIYHDKKSLYAHRGGIYGRSEEFPLAMNADDYHVVVEPSLLNKELKESNEKYVEVAEEIAKILDMPFIAVWDKISDKSKHFVYIKKDVSPYVARKIDVLRIGKFHPKGVRTEYKSRRFYPNGDATAHIVGYTDYRGVGQGGVEYMRHQALSQKDGVMEFFRAASGLPLREISLKPEKFGDNLYLTIDSRLQYIAYEQLRETVRKHRARAAAAVVMDVRNGDLLAVASYPSFNPNKIHRVDERMSNLAIEHTIEPGSTVKPFIVGLALEENKVDSNEILPTSKTLKLPGADLREDRIDEDMNVSGVIRRSSNIGAALLANRLGESSIWNLYKNIGFVDDSVLGMEEEVSGSLNHYSNWRGRDLANHSFGYGFSTTLLKLARAYSVFATNGRMRDPHIERGEVTMGKRVFSAKTAKEVRLMMETVTNPGGTGTGAAVEGYRVAGKTGTVNKVINGRYDKNKARAFFVGLAPVSNPRYVIAVMVDEPSKGVRYGGVVAGPAFKQIMRYALLFGGVPPDDTAMLSDSILYGDSDV